MISTFVTGAVDQSQWPESQLPEIVVVGRSNVGKSSFINALCNRKKLAYVGNTPGKTRMINFFDIDRRWMLVDVPGYGYAKMSKAMLKKMGDMMDTYFSRRTQIRGVIQLVDARHAPTGDDLDMIAYVQSLDIPILVVATKMDKVPKTRQIKALKQIAKTIHMPVSMILPVSSIKKTGFEPVCDAIEQWIQ
ncbi:MAG: YihA family ribosome biogenesis GTP-binding protein [Erysipelotrichaceae bacterium]|nr:YihA family ribosome biogenesis GTP-binding protein [Erysipelotrichaceae bacterium]